MFWFQGEVKIIYIKDTGILTCTGIRILSEKEETGIQALVEVIMKRKF
jgi:hypothetical protein